uniref:Uncharacterized protein n=1 Tax=Panagrolaimus superbus TaxID=310955 RepID=A0A914YN97_9BILA
MTDNQTVVDPGFCSDYFGEGSVEAKEEEKEIEEEPNGFDELSSQIKQVGKWSPDLTLAYPLTFSDKDVIFGVDGGAVLNGEKADAQRPKLSNITIIRDQVSVTLFL